MSLEEKKEDKREEEKKTDKGIGERSTNSPGI